MKRPIHILHLEDDPLDSDLVRSLLEEEGIECSIKRVDNRADFQASLEEVRFDLIISDYSLPSFDGFKAMELVRRLYPDMPIIFLSGTLGEEVAIESLKRGAVDYVLKDRLARLGASVRRAIRDAEVSAERRQFEAELRKHDELFRRIGENVEDLIAVLDLNGRRVYNSPSYRTLLGDPELLVGSDSFVEIHPEDRERIQNIFRETVKTGVGQRTEYRFLLKDGTVRFVESQGSVIRDPEGRVASVVVISRDVTRRKQVEEERRASEERLRMIIDTALDAVITMDAEGRITSWNAQAEKTFGWKREEIMGRILSEIIIPAAYRERHTLGLKHFLTTGIGPVLRQRIEIAALHRQGHEFPVELAIASVQWAGKWSFSAFVRDITDRKRAEDAIQQRAAELERFQRLSVGRELQMVELKKEVNELAKLAGRAPPYDLTFLETHTKLRNKTG